MAKSQRVTVPDWVKTAIARHVEPVEIARGLNLEEIQGVGAGEFKACCPFHEDGDGSLHLYGPGGGWYCYSCGFGGSPLNLVARSRNLNLRNADDLVAAYDECCSHAGIAWNAGSFDANAAAPPPPPEIAERQRKFEEAAKEEVVWPAVGQPQGDRWRTLWPFNIAGHEVYHFPVQGTGAEATEVRYVPKKPRKDGKRSKTSTLLRITADGVIHGIHDKGLGFYQDSQGTWRSFPQSNDDAAAKAAKRPRRRFADFKVLLYRPENWRAAAEDEWILNVEGPKDSNTGCDLLGIPTTTSIGGGKGLKEYNAVELKGRRVAVLPDHDNSVGANGNVNRSGQLAAQKRAALLYPHAKEVRVLDPLEPLDGPTPHGYDLTDWVNDRPNKTDRQRADLRTSILQMIDESPPWRPRDGKTPEDLAAEDDSVKERSVNVQKDQQATADDVLRIVARHEKNLFQKSGQLVDIAQIMPSASEKKLLLPDALVGRPQTREIPLPRLQELISHHCIFWDEIKGGKNAGLLEQVHVPRWLPPAIKARGQWPEIRVLTGLTGTPVLRADGSVLQQPGYDPGTGLYYLPRGVKFGKIPDQPTPLDAYEAAMRIRALFGDFIEGDDKRFESQDHFGSLLAALLTPLARPAYSGAQPMLMVEGNKKGVGKTLLARAIFAIIEGRDLDVRSVGKSEEEQEKRITSLLRSSQRVVVFDDETEFGSKALDRLLTGGVWTARLLGSNSEVSEKIDQLFIVTGNNPQIREDTARRVYRIRMLTDNPRPDTTPTSSFEQPDLMSHVLRNRGAIVADLLTILRAYEVAGRPKHGQPSWGGFEGWDNLVRGAVIMATDADPLGTRLQLQELDAGEVERANLVFSFSDIYSEHFADTKSKGAVADWFEVLTTTREDSEEQASLGQGFGGGKAPSVGDLTHKDLIQALKVFKRKGRNINSILSQKELGDIFAQLRDMVFENPDGSGQRAYLEIAKDKNNNSRRNSKGMLWRVVVLQPKADPPPENEPPPPRPPNETPPSPTEPTPAESPRPPPRIAERDDPPESLTEEVFDEIYGADDEPLGFDDLPDAETKPGMKNIVDHLHGPPNKNDT